jgi:hypothetical protein
MTICYYIYKKKWAEHKVTTYIYKDKFVLHLNIWTEDVSVIDGIVDDMFKYEHHIFDRFSEKEKQSGYNLIGDFIEKSLYLNIINQEVLYVKCKVINLREYNRKMRIVKLKNLLR